MKQTPTLTQVQVIQSLAEALSWMQKELDWGVAIADLPHLTGRIGELYAAMITRGQMAITTNQHGYDVVSASNERISVKTVSTSTSVSFNANTYDLVDRVIVLRIINDPDTGLSVDELLDSSALEAKALMRVSGTKLVYPLPANGRKQRPVEELNVTESVRFREWEVRKYENGAIRIAVEGVLQDIVVKDVLRTIAPAVGVEILNSAGAVKNTQQLGAEIIRAIQASEVSVP